MGEIDDIVEAARRLGPGGGPLLLATVVRVRGSSYRRPGARMLLTETACVAGSVSGGCLEHDIVRKGFWRIRDGSPALVTYDSASDEDGPGFGEGIGCNGVIDVLLERVDGARGPISFLTACADGEIEGVLATVIDSTRSDVPLGSRVAIRAGVTTESAMIPGEVRRELVRAARDALDKGKWFHHRSSCGRVETFVERISPSAKLFIFGAAPDALPVVALAKTIGLHVTVWDVYGRPSTRERFTAANRVFTGARDAIRGAIDSCALPLALVMSHDFDCDRETLGVLLRSRARYIGVLGPRRRTERMLDEPLGTGLRTGGRDLDRIHAPVGLQLGAETCEQVALSIMAEIQAFLSGCRGGSLRDAPGDIHRSSASGARPGGEHVPTRIGAQATE